MKCLMVAGLAWIGMGLAPGIGAAVSANVTLTGAGETFAKPTYDKWGAGYNATHPEVGVNYQGIGGGGGIRQIIGKSVDFGSTDGPMTEKLMEGALATILPIPTVIGAVVLPCLVPLGSLIWTLVAHGGSGISFHFLTGFWALVGELGGITHAIIGSLCLLGIASLLAIPLGQANGIFLSRNGRTKPAGFSRSLSEVMAGIPAIVVGVFIYNTVVRHGAFSLGTGFTMLAGDLTLSMIILPIFARTAEEALRLIPSSVDEACSALDPVATERIEKLLGDLKRDYTRVIVTRNIQQAAHIADRTVFRLMGDMIAEGATSDLFTNPKDPRTESFISGRFGRAFT